MAVNKNFVVKNGIEVAEDLIFASSDSNTIGIGSTVPRDTLDIRGGIAATNVYAAGVVTSTDNFYVGSSGTVFAALTGFGSVGIGTANPIFPLDIRSSASTGTTALYVYGDMRVTGDINLDDISLDDVNATDLHVSGLSTMVGNVTFAGSVNQLNVSGISTLGDVNVSGTSTFTGAIDANAGLDVDGQADLDEVVVAGVATFSNSANITGGLTADNINVTGVITATSIYGSAQIGVASESTYIGTGASVINFASSNGTAWTVTEASAGVVTATVTPGVSLGLAIALGG